MAYDPAAQLADIFEGAAESPLGSDTDSAQPVNSNPSQPSSGGSVDDESADSALTTDSQAAELLRRAEVKGTEVPSWIEQGPNTLSDSQAADTTTGKDEKGEVIGAIQTVATHPMSNDILFVGTVNGGVLRTENFTSATPTWKALTDTKLPSLAISALAVSPFTTSGDPMKPDTLDDLTVYAGTGSFSHSGRRGGAPAGLYRSINGGASWREINGARALLRDKLVTGITFATSDFRVVVVSYVDTKLNAGGVIATEDAGSTWKLASGLPGGASWDVMIHPTSSGTGKDLFLVGVSNSGVGQNGVYRSEDGGKNWTQVQAVSDTATRVRLAISSDAPQAVYAAVVDSTQALSQIFRSPSQGDKGTWAALAAAPSLKSSVSARSFSLAASGTDGHGLCRGIRQGPD